MALTQLYALSLFCGGRKVARAGESERADLVRMRTVATKLERTRRIASARLRPQGGKQCGEYA